MRVRAGSRPGVKYVGRRRQSLRSRARSTAAAYGRFAGCGGDAVMGLENKLSILTIIILLGVIHPWHAALRNHSCYFICGLALMVNRIDTIPRGAWAGADYR